MGRNGMVITQNQPTNLVQYLGPQVLVSEIINKLELVYGTVVSFDILMQNFYKLQHGKAEK